MLGNIDSNVSREEQLFMLKDFLTRGMRQSEIAEVLNISRQRVHQLLKKHDLVCLPEHKKPSSKERSAFLKEGLKDPKDYWLWYTIKRKCIPRNIFYDLKSKMPDICPILNTKLNYITLKGRPKGTVQFIPSLDKIIPENGYVKGNVRVISLKANMLKNNATLEQLERMVLYMKGEI